MHAFLVKASYTSSFGNRRRAEAYVVSAMGQYEAGVKLKTLIERSFNGSDVRLEFSAPACEQDGVVVYREGPIRSEL